MFGDLQTIFDEAIDLKDFQTAFEWSERARSRAFRDLIRDRVVIPKASYVSIDSIRKKLVGNETLIEFHSLPTRLVFWVTGKNGLLNADVINLSKEELTKRVEQIRSAMANDIGEDPREDERLRGTFAKTVYDDVLRPLRLDR